MQMSFGKQIQMVATRDSKYAEESKNTSFKLKKTKGGVCMYV